MRRSVRSVLVVCAAVSALAMPGALQAQFGKVGGVLPGQSGLPSLPNGLPQGLDTTLAGASSRSGGGALSGIFGCQASGSSQIIGAVGGGVVGGLVGSKVQKTVGTIAGGALGAAAGSWIGCRLQRSAQVRAERAAQNAAATGQGQQWSDPATGASGQSVVLPGRQQSLAGIRLASGVTPLSDYQMGGGPTTAAKVAYVRGAPSVSGPILGKLRAGEAVTVSAMTRDSGWSLVSQNGVGRGYVATALLVPPSQASASGCKIVRQTIQTGGQNESEVLNACPNGAGGWTFSKAA